MQRYPLVAVVVAASDTTENGDVPGLQNASHSWSSELGSGTQINHRDHDHDRWEDKKVYVEICIIIAVCRYPVTMQSPLVEDLFNWRVTKYFPFGHYFLSTSSCVFTYHDSMYMWSIHKFPTDGHMALTFVSILGQ
jgi:hypothetical protein